MTNKYEEIKDGQWTWEYSDNNDTWTKGTFDTKEECIAEAMAEIKANDEEEILNGFYLGRCETVGLPTIDADSLLEQLSNDVYDEVGEVAEDYLTDVPVEAINELEESLNKVFEEWADKHKMHPTFYKVTDIQFISIEEARKVIESHKHIA